MRYRNLHDGRPVPILGLGTASFGRDRNREFNAVRAALDLGYTHIDTAEGYGSGEAERVIGEAIKGHDRSKLFITTKVAPEHLGAADVPRSLEGSLSRLQTDYVDLYLIHWPSATIPLEETFGALNELVSRGQVRYLGVSNFSVAQMEESFRLTDSILAANQVRYSLLHREPERNGVLEYCQGHDVLLTAYTPIEKGRLSASSELAGMAGDKGCTPVQLALAWLLSQEQVITIPESKNRSHLEENLGALEVELSAEEKGELDRLAS